MAVTGAIIAGAGAALSFSAQQEQAEAQEDQIKASTAVETAKAARERRAAIRERRIKTAQVEQAAEAGGVSGSSGALAAPGVLATQFAAATGFQGTLQSARSATDAAIVKATKAQVTGQIGQSLFRTGFGVFQAGGGFDAFGSTQSDVEQVLNTEGLF